MVYVNVPRDEIDQGQTNIERLKKKDEKALESQMGLLKVPKL